MSEKTPLDRAFLAMADAIEDEVRRLTFYARLAESELFLLLETEAEEDRMTPASFRVGDTPYLMVFDREERLMDFVRDDAPYAALTGRALCDISAGQDLGLALNPDVAPSSYLIAPEVVNWLAEISVSAPGIVADAPPRIYPPSRAEAALLDALDAKFARMQGLARAAILVSAAGGTADDGAAGDGAVRAPLIAFLDTQAGAEDAIAMAVAETVQYFGGEIGAPCVVFLGGDSDAAARLADIGLRFDLPVADAAAVPVAPGSDPDNPPRLH